MALAIALSCLSQPPSSQVWPPAVASSATVRDLHREYSNIFRHGNRNAASHLWASFLLDRASSMSTERFELMFSGFCAVSGSLTCCNVLENEMDEATARLLVEAVKDKNISLCGIKSDWTEANFRRRGLKLPDAILLASDLSKADVSGSLTSLDLQQNNIGAEGAKALADALRVNGSLTKLDVRRNFDLDGETKTLLRDAAKDKSGFKLLT